MANQGMVNVDSQRENLSGPSNAFAGVAGMEFGGLTINEKPNIIYVALAVAAIGIGLFWISKK